LFGDGIIHLENHIAQVALHCDLHSHIQVIPPIKSPFEDKITKVPMSQPKVHPYLHVKSLETFAEVMM
jgi:hypothetical protein